MSSNQNSFVKRPWTFPGIRAVLKPDSTTVNIRVTDISPNSYVSQLHIRPLDAQNAFSSKAEKATVLRIVSIYSEATVLPLDVTSPLLESLFQQYKIPSSFANVVASFGQDPDRAEGSSSNVAIRHRSTYGNEISYQIRYVEENQRGGLDPWSLRHSGVFHRHGSSEEPDLFIILHPTRSPIAQQDLDSLENDAMRREELCKSPNLLHVWLFSAYFDNWRWYLRYLGKRFNQQNNLAMVMEPRDAEPSDSFDRVQSLRNTSDFIRFARACCSGNQELLDRLSKAALEDWVICQELENHKAGMKAYIESADVLVGRVQNLIDLTKIGYTLTLHNQLEAAQVDKELRDLTDGLKQLTEHSVDDSATVKIVTFVSAVYLPGSFIGTLYGMNFFLFNPDTKQLQISPDFWIFIATWLPLTLMTGVIYVLILYLDARSKGRKFRWPWQIRSRKSSTCTCLEKDQDTL